MPQKTSIEWCTHSSNPLRARRKDNGKVGWHCVKWSSGCAHCYAEAINLRFGTGLPFNQHSSALVELFLNTKELEAIFNLKIPSKIFVGDMTDLFQEVVPNEVLASLFAVMMVNPQHTFQLLTKRAVRLPEWFAWVKESSRGYWHGIPGFLMDCLRKGCGEGIYGLAKDGYQRATKLRWPDLTDPVESLGDSSLGPEWPLPNVWAGVSIEDQKNANERLYFLRETPASIRWISYEPALGPLDLKRVYVGDPQMNVNVLDWLDWLVSGGESGHGARSSHPDWFRAVRDDCVASGVSYFHKQWGEWMPFTDTGELKEFSAKTPVCLVKTDGRVIRPYARVDAPGHQMAKVGKKSAGRLLDGRTWDEFPEPMAAVSIRPADLPGQGLLFGGERT